MKKLTAILGGVFILFLFTSLPCAADPCLGDFDCDGDVDGYNLTQFSANFGLSDCSSNSFVVFGTAVFSGLGQTDYYEVSLETIFDPVAFSRDTQFRLKLKESGITQQLIIKAAEHDSIPEVALYSGEIPHSSNDFLKIQNVRIMSVKYLPPVQNNDPYLVEVLLGFSTFSILLDHCPSGGPAEIGFINTVGYTGSIPPTEYDDYIPISDYHFSMFSYRGQQGSFFNTFDPIEIVTAYNEVSVCFFKWVFLGSPISEVRIENFGRRRDDGPESRIKLRDVSFKDIRLVVSSGNSEVTFSIDYSRIELTHWELIAEEWEPQTTCWDVETDTQCP
jgi:hypothetical protein